MNKTDSPDAANRREQQKLADRESLLRPGDVDALIEQARINIEAMRAYHMAHRNTLPHEATVTLKNSERLMDAGVVLALLLLIFLIAWATTPKGCG